MPAGELKFGSTKSVYIDGRLFEVGIPSRRSLVCILRLSGQRLRSKLGCTSKPSDSEVLSIR